MYTKEELKEKLEKNNPDIKIKTISTYLKNWKIDPVYEDEESIEYFDEFTIAKLNQGIILKEQGSSNEEIISIINKEMKSSANKIAVKKVDMQPKNTFEETKLENITVDLTSQTLVVLAESIAQKISNDIAGKIKEGNILQPAMDIGKLKRDNEILATQIEKIIEENKKLNIKINQLLQEKDKFKKAFGSFYIKVE